MNSIGNKLERKIIEKNRRMYMKGLCYKMISLIPSHHFNPAKEFLSQQDQLEQAARYIQQLSARVEELRRRKTQALMNNTTTTNDNIIKTNKNTYNLSTRLNYNLPVLKLRDFGSNLELVLISELRKNFMLHQIIRILEEGGAEVLNANLSTSDDKIFLTLHAQVKISRVGVDTCSICGRLQELIS